MIYVDIIMRYITDIVRYIWHVCKYQSVYIVDLKLTEFPQSLAQRLTQNWSMTPSDALSHLEDAELIINIIIYPLMGH